MSERPERFSQINRTGTGTCTGWLLVCATLCAGIIGCSRNIDLPTMVRLQEIQQEFDRAQDKEQFLRVAARYQEVLDSGLRSGAVLYNQGNAFMRSQQRGRALACYRQAMRYLPNHAGLQANLEVALQGRPRPTRPWWHYLLFWQEWIGIQQKFLAAFLCGLIATLFGSSLVLFRRNIWMRNVAVTALGLSSLIAISAAVDWYRFEMVTHGVVVASESVLRKGNGVDYQPVLQQLLPEGTEFVVLEVRDRWKLVRLDGNQEGWLPTDEIVTY